MEEVWKEIFNFPGYEISSLGRVRSFRDFQGKILNEWHILKPIMRKGYYYVDLHDLEHKPHKKTIHRLVAETFLGKMEGMVVNHRDGNKTNNRLSNLEWVSIKENSTLASKSKLYKTVPVRVIETGEMFDSVLECAKHLDVDPSCVSVALSDPKRTVVGYHVEKINSFKRQPFLREYQERAVSCLKSGNILCAPVGSGKSRTGLYWYFKENGGSIDQFGYQKMTNLNDLYIITTAKKRDSLEWEKELSDFLLWPVEFYNITVVIDSWNNIKKYQNVFGAYFLFDEQRVVGSGSWVKSFLNISRKNKWLLLTATPADVYSDYIPVFVANGFYKNRTDFNRQHCIYSRFSKYPKIERYINTKKIDRHIAEITITMEDQRHTIRHTINHHPTYDKEKYHRVMVDRWNPWDDEPIQEAGAWCYLQRRVLNEDSSRIPIVDSIYQDCGRAILFYNFDYELEILREHCEWGRIHYAEWNGHKHESIPNTKKWLYLVQYAAGAEGWNCITTDTVIFYSQNYSYRTAEQAAGRIDRMNTPFKDLYYHYLWARGGIDLAIHQKLREKKNFNASNFAKKSGF